MDGAVEGRRRRRTHRLEFKARVMQACGQPGVSIASVALLHGLNANLVRRWLNGPDTGCGSSVALAAAQPCAAEHRRDCRNVRACAARDGRAHTAPRTAPRGRHPHRQLTQPRGGGLRQLAARVAAMIRIDAMWLAVEPVDMRAGADRLLARVVQVFGAARDNRQHTTATSSPIRARRASSCWCTTDSASGVQRVA